MGSKLPGNLIKMFFELSARQAPELPPPPPSKAYLEESYAPKMLAVVGTLFGLAMISVLLRIYVRTTILKTFGVDGMYLFEIQGQSPLTSL